jgi:hypothetical protein
MPIENTLEGSVTATLDALAFETDLIIHGELELPVNLVLAAPPGTTLADRERALARRRRSARRDDGCRATCRRPSSRRRPRPRARRRRSPSSVWARGVVNPLGRGALRARGPRRGPRGPHGELDPVRHGRSARAAGDGLGQDVARRVHRHEPSGCAAAAARDLRRSRPEPHQDRVASDQDRARRVLLLPRRRGPRRRRAGRRCARDGEAHPAGRACARLLPALRVRGSVPRPSGSSATTPPIGRRRPGSRRGAIEESHRAS